MSPSSKPDRGAAAKALTELIRALGLDPKDDPELVRSPERMADYYAEAISGLDPEGSPDLATFPHTGHDDLVIVRDLEFHSICVHHFAPFFGHATIAYVPGDSIIGISGPARLLEFYSRRPQLQERITTQIADHLERLVKPRGVAVMLSARHLCMEMRGIRRRGQVETSTHRGVLGEPRWAAALGTPRT